MTTLTITQPLDGWPEGLVFTWSDARNRWEARRDGTLCVLTAEQAEDGIMLEYVKRREDQ